jgi:hypothetical protein
MLAKISEGIPDAVRQLKGAPFLAEYKYDGERPAGRWYCWVLQWAVTKVPCDLLAGAAQLTANSCSGLPPPCIGR